MTLNSFANIFILDYMKYNYRSNFIPLNYDSISYKLFFINRTYYLVRCNPLKFATDVIHNYYLYCTIECFDGYNYRHKYKQM